MNWLDVIIIIALAASLFSGWRNGLIRSLFSLVGLIAAVKLAGAFYIEVAGRLNFISDEKAARIAAFGIILAAVMLIVFVVAWLLTKIAASLTLGWLNGLGGAAFGLFMGVLVISTLLSLWVRFFDSSQAITDSGLAALMIRFAGLPGALLPSEFDLIRGLFK